MPLCCAEGILGIFHAKPLILEFSTHTASGEGAQQCPDSVWGQADPVPASSVFPVFSYAVDAMHELGHLKPYRSINGGLLVAMGGTRYFSSTKVHCSQCSITEQSNGTITYSHTVVTPVIVASGNPRVLPLEPEFITPQDGHKKQDCENAAAKTLARPIRCTLPLPEHHDPG